MSWVRVTAFVGMAIALTACDDEIASGVFRCSASVECPPGFVCRHEGVDPRTYCFDTGNEELSMLRTDAGSSTARGSDAGVDAAQKAVVTRDGGTPSVEQDATVTRDRGAPSAEPDAAMMSSADDDGGDRDWAQPAEIGGWQTGDFGDCSTSCGAGTRTRSVECIADDGSTLPDELCAEQKPASSEACNATADCSWKTDAFGACTSSCGSGVQTRNVVCSGPDLVPVDEGFCTAVRPANSQTCFSSTTCAWSTDTWSACSAHCGSGTKSRAVTCVDGNGITVPNGYCSGVAPSSTQGCSGPACTVYVVGEPTAANGPCYKPGCTGPTPAYASCPSGYAAVREETACGDPNVCGDNWALCTFNQVTGYGCTGQGFSMPVAVRQCNYQ